MALMYVAATGPAVTGGNNNTMLWVTGAVGYACRLVRQVIGQSATTTSGQFAANFYRATAVGTTNTGITPQPAQLNQAAAGLTYASSTDGAAGTVNAVAFYVKSGNVLSGCEQTWQRSQSEFWLLGTANLWKLMVNAVGAAMTPRFTFEFEEVGLSDIRVPDFFAETMRDEVFACERHDANAWREATAGL